MAEASAPATPAPRFRLERRVAPSPLTAALVPLVSIPLALLVGAVVLLLSGEDPLAVYRAMAEGAFGSRDGVAETLVKTTPLLLTGLGVAVAFRMGLWNIGAEGQLYLGAVAASGVALFVLDGAPAPVLIPAMAGAALAAGALWALGPALLRAFAGVNETITTLLLNYVAVLFSEWLIHGPWRDPAAFGFPGSAPFPEAAELPRWADTRVHLGLAFGLAAAALLWVLLRRTRWGYEVGVMGENPRAARYAGLPTRRNVVLVLCLSGALAGLAGMGEVAGLSHGLGRGVSPGYGYTAIIVAWLARLNPLAIVPVSFLLAGVLVGGDRLQMELGLPAAFAPMLQGVVLFFLLGGETLARYRVVRAGSGAGGG